MQKKFGGTFVTCTKINYTVFKNGLNLPAWKRGYITYIFPPCEWNQTKLSMIIFINLLVKSFMPLDNLQSISLLKLSNEEYKHCFVIVQYQR